MNMISRFKRAIALGGLFLTLTFSISGYGLAPAIASSLDSVHPLVAVTATAQDLDQKAKRDLDKVAGSGTSDQLEGITQQAAGTLKRQAGKVSSQLEGAADQVQGRAKVDLGRTKGAAEDLGETAQKSGENLIDSVKDFFDS